MSEIGYATFVPSPPRHWHLSVTESVLAPALPEGCLPKNSPPTTCPKCSKPMRFLVVKTGGRKFRCAKCLGMDPMSMSEYRGGSRANYSRRNCSKAASVGGLTAQLAHVLGPFLLWGGVTRMNLPRPTLLIICRACKTPQLPPSAFGRTPLSPHWRGSPFWARKTASRYRG